MYLSELSLAKSFVALIFKPVLNWANCLFADHTPDSSTTMIRFLIEHLVR